MCLAVPVRVVEIDGDNGTVDSGGVKQRTSLMLVEDVKVGDWVLMHAGFAIKKWTEDEVAEYDSMVKEMADAGIQTPGMPAIDVRDHGSD